jgi:4-amino-4-deoxy-L-arabinose transferase-like glycosyltransferase
MLFPIGAAHLITTDYVLAACETLAMWAFVEARFGDRDRASRWIAAMWAGFGLAFLAKGPPGLLPLLAVFAFDAATPGRVRPRALQWQGLLLFVLIALPWYAIVMQRNPGLMGYFLGNEVVGRVATNEFGRHGQWYGWITIYIPTLLVGTLPWTPALFRWLRQLPTAAHAWRTRDGRSEDPAQLLLACWLVLPLLVFCVSRSRLPLYILPLFVPLAVLAARQRCREGRPLPRWRWLLAWMFGAFALQLAAARWPTHKDASAWTHAIHLRVPGPITQVDFVDDMARYGLHLHLGVDVEKLSLAPITVAPRFNPEYDESVADEIADDFDPDSLWITKRERWPAVRSELAALGIDAIAQGTPYQDRVLFRVRRSR